MASPCLAPPDGDDHEYNKDDDNDQINRRFSSGEFSVRRSPPSSGVFTLRGSHQRLDPALDPARHVARTERRNNVVLNDDVGQPVRHRTLQAIAHFDARRA